MPCMICSECKKIRPRLLIEVFVIYAFFALNLMCKVISIAVITIVAMGRTNIAIR